MEVMFLNNTVLSWLTALGIAVGVALALHLVKNVVVHRLGIIAARTDTKLDDIAVAALLATRTSVILIMGLYAGSTVLALPLSVKLFATRFAIVSGLIQAAIWGNTALRAWLAEYYGNTNTDPARATSAAAVGFIARMVLWIVILLMILDNLGVNITTLVASLGIGGIAVALAVQNILGDLFASLSIVLDKPFVIGDFVIVDKFLGTIEYVGLKTTRIRSLSGEQLVFSNADLLRSRLQNMTRMNRRRVVFGVSVTYDTPTSKLRAIPPLLTELVKARETVSFDRAHFSGIGPSSYNFEVVYWVETPDYLRFMDIQQEIYLQMLDRFAEMDIELAFPAQTLHVRDARDLAAQARDGIVPVERGPVPLPPAAS
ncbi:mechanosensitive ion channel protein MscS [Massilia sp. WF1]|uniref:mechanosensitive ion channel family protein n=1 Tax=unclassified Massilia TaxID=2609279 RepID=UPI00064A0415|nr:MULTISPECIES: mechanosensitive ion channel family protein [unclassified Massilia]ALK99314.1 mechanosensitive ion channel protein MscS [Massilia sp. WG5]KLU35771.1 mechanosensitive ion channel protein MscS [Massilia sp. WF1]